MSAFEKFLQGEDALTRLIRRQPAFEPTAEQEARLFAALTSVQFAITGEFEPPAAMEATFLQQARAIAEAQTPRRDALLDRLHKGEPAEAVLGHKISPATQNWLASQPIAPGKNIASPAPRTRWWQWSGMILAPALLAGIGFQLLLPAPREQPANLALIQPAAAPQPAAAMQLAETRKESAQSTTKPVSDTRKKTRNIAAYPLQLAESLPAPSARTNATAAPRMMAAAPPAPDETFTAPLVKPAPIMLAADKLAMDSSKEQAAPALAAMVSPQRMEAEVMSRTTAAKLILAKKSAASYPRIILLSDDPGLVAAELLPSTRGYIVLTADPASQAAQDWLTRLREVLRAHTTLQVETDSTLASGQLLIFPINPEMK